MINSNAGIACLLGLSTYLILASASALRSDFEAMKETFCQTGYGISNIVIQKGYNQSIDIDFLFNITCVRLFDSEASLETCTTKYAVILPHYDLSFGDESKTCGCNEYLAGVKSYPYNLNKNGTLVVRERRFHLRCCTIPVTKLTLGPCSYTGMRYLLSPWDTELRSNGVLQSIMISSNYVVAKSCLFSSGSVASAYGSSPSITDCTKDGTGKDPPQCSMMLRTPFEGLNVLSNLQIDEAIVRARLDRGLHVSICRDGHYASSITVSRNESEGARFLDVQCQPLTYSYCYCFWRPTCRDTDVQWYLTGIRSIWNGPQEQWSFESLCCTSTAVQISNCQMVISPSLPTVPNPYGYSNSSGTPPPVHKLDPAQIIRCVDPDLETTSSLPAIEVCQYELLQGKECQQPCKECAGYSVYRDPICIPSVEGTIANSPSTITHGVVTQESTTIISTNATVAVAITTATSSTAATTPSTAPATTATSTTAPTTTPTSTTNKTTSSTTANTTSSSVVSVNVTQPPVTAVTLIPVNITMPPPNVTNPQVQRPWNVTQPPILQPTQSTIPPINSTQSHSTNITKAPSTNATLTTENATQPSTHTTPVLPNITPPPVNITKPQIQRPVNVTLPPLVLFNSTTTPSPANATTPRENSTSPAIVLNTTSPPNTTVVHTPAPSNTSVTPAPNITFLTPSPNITVPTLPPNATHTSSSTVPASTTSPNITHPLNVTQPSTVSRPNPCLNPNSTQNNVTSSSRRITGGWPGRTGSRPVGGSAGPPSKVGTEDMCNGTISSATTVTAAPPSNTTEPGEGNSTSDTRNVTMTGNVSSTIVVSTLRTVSSSAIISNPTPSPLPANSTFTGGPNVTISAPANVTAVSKSSITPVLHSQAPKANVTTPAATDIVPSHSQSTSHITDNITTIQSTHPTPTRPTCSAERDDGPEHCPGEAENAESANFTLSCRTHCYAVDKGHHRGATCSDKLGIGRSSCTCHFDPCRNSAMDIVFLLDSSGSLEDGGFLEEINFLKNFISKMTLGANESRVGLVQFSTSAETIFGLSDSQVQLQNAVKDKLDNLYYDAGDTNITAAFFAAIPLLENTQRPGVPQVVVLVTDGIHNQGPPSPTLPSSILRQQGVLIYAVGIGPEASRDHLTLITGDSNRVFMAQFSDLGNVLNVIGAEVTAAVNS